MKKLIITKIVWILILTTTSCSSPKDKYMFSRSQAMPDTEANRYLNQKTIDQSIEKDYNDEEDDSDDIIVASFQVTTPSGSTTSIYNNGRMQAPVSLQIKVYNADGSEYKLSQEEIGSARLVAYNTPTSSLPNGWAYSSQENQYNHNIPSGGITMSKIDTEEKNIEETSEKEEDEMKQVSAKIFTKTNKIPPITDKGVALNNHDPNTSITNNISQYIPLWLTTNSQVETQQIAGSITIAGTVYSTHMNDTHGVFDSYVTVHALQSNRYTPQDFSVSKLLLDHIDYSNNSYNNIYLVSISLNNGASLLSYNYTNNDPSKWYFYATPWKKDTQFDSIYQGTDIGEYITDGNGKNWYPSQYKEPGTFAGIVLQSGWNDSTKTAWNYKGPVYASYLGVEFIDEYGNSSKVNIQPNAGDNSSYPYGSEGAGSTWVITD